jgi:uncharacterized lipoprotein YddW (UPF0748 family)
MNKREFLKAVGLGGLSLAASRALLAFRSPSSGGSAGSRKNWVWMPTDVRPSGDEWKRRFAEMREAGIDAVLPEVYNSRHAYYASKHLPVAEHWLETILPLAKSEGLEVHAWMWTMPCNVEGIRKAHPEWYVVNRKGESAESKPAYVEHYRFLCPSRLEVHEFIEATVTELAQYDALDGIHLDYIRYPDVILAEGLQPKYGIVQDREYPEYDYCYCDVCRKEFQEKTGIDPLELEDPSTSAEWKQFRYDKITFLVNNKLFPIARENKKLMTAAVFPNWEAVRQQWSAWNIDAVMPMLYHGFYNKGIDWIREQTEVGVRSLRGRMPLYSGLFVPQLTPEALAEAVDASFSGGADGIVLFSAQAMSSNHWRSLQKALR